MTTTERHHLSTCDIIYTNNKMYNPVTQRDILHTNKNYKSVLNQIQKYNTKHNLTAPETPPTNRTTTENLINATPATATAPPATPPTSRTKPIFTKFITPSFPTTSGTAPETPAPPRPTHNYIYNYEVNVIDGFKYVKEKIFNCTFAKNYYSISVNELMEDLRKARGDDETTLYKFFIDDREEPIQDRLGISQHKDNIFYAIPYEIPQPQRFRTGYFKFVSKQATRDSVSRNDYNIIKVTKSFVTIRYKYNSRGIWTDEQKFKIRYDDTYNNEKTKIEGFYILLQGCGYTGCDDYRLYFSDLEEK